MPDDREQTGTTRQMVPPSETQAHQTMQPSLQNSSTKGLSDEPVLDQAAFQKSLAHRSVLRQPGGNVQLVGHFDYAMIQKPNEP